MDKIQMRFFEFASEVFQIAAPLVDNPRLEDTVRELVMASSRMGASFYRKNFWDFTEEEFQENMSSARMDLHDSLLFLHILIKDCPDNHDLQVLEMKAHGFMVFLGGVVDAKMAV
jgi:hypothetical protein